jgi:hypothetical protein
MGMLTDQERFDPLHMHSLVDSINKDLLHITAAMDGTRGSGLDEDHEDYHGMEDDYQQKADVFIQKMGKQKKKNQGKGGRKGSKNMPVKDSESTSDG